MNLKVDVIESEEGPGYGAAILAAVGCGEFENVESAVDKLVHVVETVEPDTELVEKYENATEIQKLLSGIKRIVLIVKKMVHARK